MSDPKYPATPAAPRDGTLAPRQDRSFALALGGGAARGLAHIPLLEVIDEFAIRPRVIAGTSIGALIGAVYASGMPGRDIRRYAKDLFASRTELVRRLVTRWPGSIGALFNLTTPAIVNPETLFRILLPDTLPETFEELSIPLRVVATDFHAQAEVVLSSGPLLPAISASSALPALLTPVRIGDRILIDGGFVNPTPFDRIRDAADLTIAIDVTGQAGRRKSDMPSSIDTWVGAAQIMLHSIVTEKLKSERPDLLVRPHVAPFTVLDFYRIDEILAAAEPARDELRRGLERLLVGAPDAGGPPDVIFLPST
ncbi:MAG: patatin-like phospholipase family protein [Rhizobiales bacterium]|nr:patatin-like phospholipase family protein [Hyphomicrobiales bacterium]